MAPVRVILVAAVVVGMLAGCAPRDAEPTAPPVAETPIETPAPEPTRPAIDELVLSPEGLENLVIGEEPPVIDPALDILVFDADACQAEVDEGFITDPGKWLPAYGDPLAGEAPFSAFVTDGILRELAIFDPAIMTEDGLGLGSSREDVLAVYPDAEVVEVGPNTDLYVVTGEHGRILFEIGEDDNEEYAKGEVVFLRVSDFDAARLHGWANTDAGYSGCTYA